MRHPLRIVLADDEAEIRDHFQLVLERLGHQVVAAVGNGADLVTACLQCQPDLVISDVRMPQMDGEQAAREIQKARPIPVILVSAYTQSDRFSGAAPSWSYLSKPVRRADLEAAIDAAVPADGTP
jgi:two-component system, response regulator PdtaR